MYKRAIVLEARDDPNGEPFLVLNGDRLEPQLRIRVEMESNLAQQLAQARVQIYNLSLSNSQRLAIGNLTPMSTGDAKEVKPAAKVHITIYAGYEDEVMNGGKHPVLISGWVMNATSRRALPNHITTLYVLPISSSFLQLTYEPWFTEEGSTLSGVLTKLCTEVGLKDIQFYWPEDKKNKPIRGQTLAGAPDLYSTLKSLSTTHSFTFAMTAAGIGFYPLPDDSELGHSEFNHLMKTGKPFTVPVELVRGAPQFSMLSVQVTLNADAEIKPGWVLDMSDVMGTTKGRGDTALPADGIADFTSVGKYLYYADDVGKYAILTRYMVSRVAHVLDNYSDDWQTHCVCIVPSSGKQDERAAVR